jgi:hypothetical protein
MQSLSVPKASLGASVLFAQILWMALLPASGFPYFESILLLSAAGFLAFEKTLKKFLLSSFFDFKNIFLFLTITILVACLGSAEKIYASWLIWGLAVILQGLVAQYIDTALQSKRNPNPGQILLVIATQAAILFLLLGDTNYYMNDTLTYGTVTTAQHIRLGSPLWMLTYFLFPALLVYRFANSHLPSAQDFWNRLQHEGDTPFRPAIYKGFAVLFAIMALLTAEMLRPHLGQGITLGDESGYTIYARALAQFDFKGFVPSQPPLYMATLALLTWLFGDQTQLALLLNCALLAGTFVLLIYAAQALTKNLFFSLLVAIFFVCNRATYLYVWTALTEPMTALVLAAAMAAALHLIQKKTFSAYIWFGVACAATILLRSQITLFTYLLIALTAWYLYQNGAKPRRNDVFIFLAVLFVPQLLWALYRYHFTGNFEFTDGRGVYMLYGYNTPNMYRGLDGVWTDGLNAWMKANPEWKPADMLWAAVKMRLDNPMETLSFWYWRTVELFNFRYIEKFGLLPILKSNLQLIILYGLFALTLFWRRSYTHLITLALLTVFYISFILVFSDSRYRYPGDVIMYLAVARLLYECFTPRVEKLDTPVKANYLQIFTHKWLYAPVLAVSLVLALPNVTGAEREILGHVPTRTVAARDEKLTITNITPIPLKSMNGQLAERLSGRMVTVPLVFEGFRFRLGWLSDVIDSGIPDGNFNYASLHGFEMKVIDPTSKPSEMLVKKFALETESLYVGPKIRIGKPYNAKVLLLKKPVVKGPEGKTFIGRLLTAESAELKKDKP